MANKRCSNSSDIMNWIELYPELLILISKKLVDIRDFVCFRATCRSWRSATSVIDFTSLHPWISSLDNIFLRGELTFYRLSSEGFAEIKFTKLRDNRWIEGLSYWKGYVLVANDRFSIMSIINPVTNREIHLPSIPSKYDDCRLLGFESDNDGIPKFVAILANHSADSSTLCYCHIGDKKWTKVYEGDYMPFSTCKYYKSKFFACYAASKSQIYDDITHVSIIHKLPASLYLSYDSYFDFCVSEDGLIGIVVTSNHSLQHVYFEVYRLENENANARWTKTTDIGDQIIYCTLYKDCEISSTDNLSDCKANCIYFIQLYCGNNYLRRFDIEKETIQEVMQLPMDVDSWFLPSLV